MITRQEYNDKWNKHYAQTLWAIEALTSNEKARYKYTHRDTPLPNAHTCVCVDCGVQATWYYFPLNQKPEPMCEYCLRGLKTKLRTGVWFEKSMRYAIADLLSKGVPKSKLPVYIGVPYSTIHTQIKRYNL